MDPNTQGTIGKKWYTSAILVPFLIVAAIFVYFLVTQMDTDSEADVEKTQSSTSGLELALNMTHFIESTLTPENVFTLRYTCSLTPNGMCVPEGTDSSSNEGNGPVPHSGYAILSFYNTGNKTNNPEMAERSRILTDTMVDRCKDDTLYCEWNFFPLYRFAIDTGDAKYKNAMLSITDTLLKDYTYDEYISNNIPSKLNMIYEVSGDEKFKDKLVEIAEETLATPLENRNDNDFVYLSDSGYAVREGSIQTVWGIYIPAYLATKNAAYRDAARDYFLNAELAEKAQYTSVAGVTALVKGVEALTAMETIDPQYAPFYKDEAHKIMQYLIQQFVDTPENEKATADYGVIVGTEKLVNMTGWVASTLANEMPEEIFTYSRY